MKKALFLSVVVCLFIVAAQAQSCDPGDLSISGLSHYNKSMEYIEHLDLGTHEKAVEELEALIKTDSLWCDGVYKQLGYLCELIYNDSKNNIAKQRKFLKKAVHYYKVYLRFNENDRAVINNVSKLESLLDIGQTTINNSIKIEMVYVEGILNKDTTDCIHSFFMGKYEVTQAQWEAVMESNPSYFKGPNLPIENISDKDALLFIKELNRLTGNNYRLPTEVEWKYAAHGGKIQDEYVYSGGYAPDKVAWTANNSFGRTHPVGEKEPNSLGIFDMTGNVSEMCKAKDDLGENVKEVFGGNFSLNPSPINSGSPYDTYYYKMNPQNIGFRLVLPIESYIGDEQNWEQKIYAKKQAMKIKNEEALQRKYKYHFYPYPIIRFIGGKWIDFNIGYNFNSEIPIAHATISMGPVFASALAFDSASFFCSVGASLWIINLFNFRLGLAYSVQNNMLGVDVGLEKRWKYYGVSGGALLFLNDEIIPHLEIMCYGVKVGAIKHKNQIIPMLGVRFWF